MSFGQDLNGFGTAVMGFVSSCQSLDPNIPATYGQLAASGEGF
jgi:hypothetical protein